MPPVTEAAVDLAKATSGDAVVPPSTVDVGAAPSTAAVQAAAAAGAQPSAVPPPLADPPPAVPPVVPPVDDAKPPAGKRKPTKAELELAELREQLAEMQARLDVAAAGTVGGLQHAVFCQPRPGNDEPRLERIRTERIHPRTQQSLGVVTVVRCLECGAQRDDLDISTTEGV